MIRITGTAPALLELLLCVSKDTRPDITFAVSQVVQHTACPKESHARAVKCITHCLAGTADKGIIVKHNETCDLKVWADADFAGTFGQEPSGSAKAVKSRCGHSSPLEEFPQSGQNHN